MSAVADAILAERTQAIDDIKAVLDRAKFRRSQRVNWREREEIDRLRERVATVDSILDRIRSNEHMTTQIGDEVQYDPPGGPMFPVVRPAQEEA